MPPESTSLTAPRPAETELAFELFRRAICERDERAWQQIVERYRGLVASWVGQHAAGARLSDEGEYWVNGAFERFWFAVTADRWDRFSDVLGLLKYLKLCAHSLVLDDLRRRRGHPDTPLDLVANQLGDTGERELSAQVLAEEVWRAVVDALPEPGDRLVAYLSLVQGCTPRDIHARHPGRFASVQEVYRVKRNMVDRLRRSPELRRALGPTAGQA
jgi:DNA-directed RNA polymerase specialized sigma24 family protein